MTWLALFAAATLFSAASPTLEQSASLYSTGDFEGALVSADSALRTEPSGLGRARLHLLRARCLVALRRMNEVDASLENALTDDPSLTLEKLDVSPAFAATFERARVRLAGTLSIETEPAGAGIRIDGALLGSSPVTQTLPVGLHRVVVLDSAGQQAILRSITVAPRQTQTVVLMVPIVAPVVQPPVVEPNPPQQAQQLAPQASPWPVTPAIVARGSFDLRAGASIEVGATAIGTYWLVELDAVIARFNGLGLRGGGRLPVYKELLSLQLTLDGVAFFAAPSVFLGIGGTASAVVHPLSWLEVMLEGGARFVLTEPQYRSQYGLLGLGVRLRWPTAIGP